MKTVIWGDLHGSDIWKRIVSENPDADKYISIGDYFDTHTGKSGESQIENFKDIIQFYDDNPGKVVLLIGNHDYHYLDVNERYSGFQKGFQYLIRHLIETHLDKMQICYVNGNFIFSHAGVSSVWLQKHFGNPPYENLQEKVNDLFKYKPLSFKFDGQNNYGDDITQGPLWIRPSSLNMVRHPGVHIVGHTFQPKIFPPDDKNAYNGNIWLIDCLETSKEYLIITDGKIEIKKA